MTMYRPPERHTRLIVTVVVVGALLATCGVAAAVLLLPDKHGCRSGYHWGYGGNPTGMTPEEIDAASTCLKDGMAYKPIIYLYPERPTDVTVSLSHPENLTAQYPAYGDGWRVQSQPDGDLVDLASGRDLYALYYESRNQVPATMAADGFVVPGDQTAPFLEGTLARLGLSPRESEEFIVYWLPILQQNPWNYIRFQTPAEIDANQALTITPAPDTTIRVMMTYQPLDAPVQVEPQSLPPTPERVGFVAVEWGGTPIVSG